MSLTGGSKFILTGGANYQIARSLRFRSTNSAYLTRTPGVAGSRTTFTISAWVKRSELGGAGYSIFDATDASKECLLVFGGSAPDQLQFYHHNGATYDFNYISAGRYRDPSAWMHVVVAMNTTLSGNAMCSIYVNGSEISYDTRTNPSASFSTNMNSTTAHRIGMESRVNRWYMDGFVSEFNFIDGQQLTPSSFGQTDATTGAWNPIKYTGTYGTNGFYLKGDDPLGAAPIAAAIGGNDTYTKGLWHGNSLGDSAWNRGSDHALTATGGTISSTQTKLGLANSLKTVAASSQYFRTDAHADFQINATSGNANDFTFDFWFYNTGNANPYPIFSLLDIGYPGLLSVGYNQFYSSSNSSTWDIASSKSLGGGQTANTWNHYAFVRSGSTWYIFVNGTQVDTWTSSLAPYYSSNYLQIGRAQGGTYYSDGYYQEIRWSKGIARWTGTFTPPAKPYSGGFGSDYSGNANDFYPSGMSNTAGVTNDSLVDTPTNYGTDTGAGGEVRGNYCTWNPLNKHASAGLTDGNLSFNSGGSVSVHRGVQGTLGSTSKFYGEITTSGGTTGMVCIFGANKLLQDMTQANNHGGYAWSFGLGYATNASGWYAGTNVTQANGSSTNVVDGTWGIAVDPAAGKAWMRNSAGSWIGGGDPAAGTSPTFTWTADGDAWTFGCSTYNVAATFLFIINAGQRPFAYAAPSGFKALCTQNLPDPAILKPKNYMDVNLRTGTGAAFNVTGIGFQPDLVWSKGRSGATDHAMYDSVRGVQKDIGSNLSTAETTEAQGITAFNSDGFSGGTLAKLNTSAATYVDWLFKKGATPGFDIVSYTGNGANRTIAHALGVAPKMMLIKDRSGVNSWRAYHSSLPTSATNGLVLNGTNAAIGPDATLWNSADPTSSVFSLGSAANLNTNLDTYIAYLFAEVAGFSKFGSYTGNGSTDGPPVWCGFRPKFVLLKRYDSTSFWQIRDTTRFPSNGALSEIYCNLSNAEIGFVDDQDNLSNGFKLRRAADEQNASGGTYIFAAFAEAPFKTARAR